MGNKKSILLIHPCSPGIFPPPGIGYLAGAIRHVFLPSEMEVKSVYLDDALRLLPSRTWDYVGVSFHSFSVRYASVIRNFVDLTRTRLICGGHHPSSSLGKELIEMGYEVIIGPGENPLINLLKGTQDVIYFPDIDSLPFPCYDDFASSIKAFGNTLSIISSRGCPFRCSFCASSVFWNRKIQLRSVDNVFNEIIHYLKKGIKHWMFEDDNFTFSVLRTKELCKKLINLKNVYSFTWECASRAETLNDPELCELMYRAGCRKVWLGVESLSQETLDRCKKGSKVPEIMSGISTAEKNKLNTMSQFIIGLPGDTMNNIQETARNIQRSAIRTFGSNIAWILPDTEIYDIALRRGFNPSVYLRNGAPYYTYEQPLNVLRKWQQLINTCK